MATDTGDLTAQELDTMFGGAGDPASAFVMAALMGATMNETIRSTVIVAVIQALLTAFVLTKAFSYMTSPNRDDPVWVVVSVGLLSLFAALSVVATNAELHYLFTHRLDIENHVTRLMLLVHLVLSVVHYSVSITQAFFAYRAFILWDRNIAVLIFFGLFITASFTVSTVTDVVSMKDLPNVVWSSITPAEAGPLLKGYGVTMVKLIRTIIFLIFGGEVALTTLLVIGLLRKKTGWKHTSTLVNRAILIISEAMLPPLVCHIVSIITFMLHSGLGTVNVAVSAIVPAVHLWTVVATLSMRDRLRNTSTNSVLQTRTNAGVRSRFTTAVDHSMGPKGTTSSRSEDEGEYHVLTAVRTPERNHPSNSTLTNGVVIDTDEFVTVDKLEEDERKSRPICA